jgi:polar amino acid transport system substrate-binding protein
MKNEVGKGTTGAAGTAKPARPRRFVWAGAAALVCLAAGLALWRVLTPSAGGSTLKWGGDANGGAPYIFETEGRLTGFEYELADYLANKLGKRPEFVQKDWDSLPQDLERGDIDLVLNGYEWFPDREAQMASTIPYFVYRLQLVVRTGSPLAGWEDLRRKPGGQKLRVGVLVGTAAERYLKEKFADDVEIVAPDAAEGATGVMRMVELGKLDATVQDEAAVVYYVGAGRDFPRLKPVGEAIEPAEHSAYVIFVRKNDLELRDRLNAALLEGLRDGTLEAIYRKYNLWHPEDHARLLRLADNWPPVVSAGPSEGLGDYAWILARAARMTVLLACVAMPLAMLLGLIVAVGRLYGPRWLDALLTVYVEVLRGTPFLLQLTVIYYLLPLHLDVFSASLLGLALNYSANEAENYRAGLLAIPRGQMEAALSLGMSTFTALRRVVIPQAVRIVIPPVTNDFIALFKDTSICGAIGVLELTKAYRGLAVAHPGVYVQLGLMTAGLYLAMSYPLSLLARRLERRFQRVAA